VLNAVTDVTAVQCLSNLFSLFVMLGKYVQLHTHTCRPVDGSSMNEECVAVDAAGSVPSL